MTIENSKATNEASIRKLINERVKAVNDKDINVLLSNYAPDILFFDVIKPLQYTDSDPVRKCAEQWLFSFQGPIGYQIRDLEITIGNNGAFCHFLDRVSGTLIDGGKINMWVRATVYFRQIDSKWMIMHEHQSVPFDVETGRASLDLTNK